MKSVYLYIHGSFSLCSITGCTRIYLCIFYFSFCSCIRCIYQGMFYSPFVHLYRAYLPMHVLFLVCFSIQGVFTNACCISHFVHLYRVYLPMHVLFSICSSIQGVFTYACFILHLFIYTGCIYLCMFYFSFCSSIQGVFTYACFISHFVHLYRVYLPMHVLFLHLFIYTGCIYQCMFYSLFVHLYSQIRRLHTIVCCVPSIRCHLLWHILTTLPTKSMSPQDE